MNYIKEINAFYQKQETNQLSSNAANLWHTLMHINNRAGWKQKFTVAVSVLSAKANLSNSTFKRARTELRDKGYIRYESQGGNRSAIYEIISSEETNMDQGPDQKDDLNKVNFEPKTEVPSKETEIMDHKAAPLYKQNETKQKNTTTAAAGAIEFFQKNIGTISPYIMEELIKWVNEVGQPFVLEAMKRALERGKGNWGYAKGILQSWLDKGFKCVQEIESEVLAFKQKAQQRSRVGRSGSQEIIPDWFHEQKKKQRKAKPHVIKEVSMKEREEVDRMLAAYG